MEGCLLCTRGGRGWPQPGCPCASCAPAPPARRHPEPTPGLVGGVLRIEPGRAPAPAPGYRVGPGPGGWAVTGPDGARLLVGDGPGAGPGPVAGAGAPYDVVLLDLLGDPARLGALRHQGLVRPSAAV